jgi:hypothetical protein
MKRELMIVTKQSEMSLVTLLCGKQYIETKVKGSSKPAVASLLMDNNRETAMMWLLAFVALLLRAGALIPEDFQLHGDLKKFYENAI